MSTASVSVIVRPGRCSWSFGRQILDIADEPDLDPRDRQIRAHTRQWLMSKLSPRRFGNKLELSGDPEQPLQVMHKQVNLAELTDEQLEVLDRFRDWLIEAKGP